jgi:hypothetical protein
LSCVSASLEFRPSYHKNAWNSDSVVVTEALYETDDVAVVDTAAVAD